MLRIALLMALVFAALAAPALGGAASAPGSADIARADALAAQWGRCPTARPAQRALDRAKRTTAPQPRARRARAAVKLWTQVAKVCSQPVPQPTVIVSG